MGHAENRTVSIFGANDPREGDAAYEQARAVGRRLAELGYAVANGGYGGTMEASARGAAEAGGETIGVTCGLWRSKPNRWISRTVATRDLSERVAELVRLGGAGYVILPGATGTLVELAVVWENMSKGLMPRRPMVCVGEFWRPVVDLMAAARPASGGFVNFAAGPEELDRFFPPA